MHDILVKTTHLLASSLELWGACDPDRGLSQPELLLQAQAGGSLYRGRQVFFFLLRHPWGQRKASFVEEAE